MPERFFLCCLLILSSLVVPTWASGDDPLFTVVEKGNKKGLYNEDGQLLIPIRYDDLGWSQGDAQVYHKVIGFREGARWGLINVRNERVSEPVFYHLLPHQDKLVIASQEKADHQLRYGLINVKGEQVLAFRYLSLRSHHAQLIASVAKAQQRAFGVINSEGEALIGFKYAAIRPVAENRYAVRSEAGQEALFSNQGEALTLFQYDSISTFEHGLAISYRQGKQGIIDQSGVEQLPNQYQQVKIASRRSVSVLPFSEWQAYTSANRLIREYSFDDLQPVGVNLYQAKIGSVRTYINGTGEVIIPERWKVMRLNETLAVVTDHQEYGVLSNVPERSRSERSRPEQKNQLVVPVAYDSVRIDNGFIIAGKRVSDRRVPDKSDSEGKSPFNWQLFDQEGTLLSTYVYQDIGALHEGRFAAKRKNLWGYLDTSGQEVIACQYQSATPFSEQRASVHFQEGQGVINTAGQWVVKPLRQGGSKTELERVNENVYIFRAAGHRLESAQWGLIDQQGREFYRTNHQLIDNGNSLWERSSNDRYGLVSYTGRRLLETRYDSISALHEGKIYTYHRDGRVGILSWDGRTLQDLNNNFEELQPMSDGFLGVRINGKYGFVDEWGRLRIANRYDSVTHFSSNVAAVKVMGNWGYIDKEEHLVVQPRFDCAYPFRGEAAVVKKNGKFGLVNTRGRTVVPTVYDRIATTEGGRYLLYRNDPQRGLLMGLVSETGKPLVHPKYESVEDLNNGFVMVGRKGKYGLLTTEGRPTIPMIHSRLIHDPHNEVYFSVTSPKWQTVKLNSDF